MFSEFNFRQAKLHEYMNANICSHFCNLCSEYSHTIVKERKGEAFIIIFINLNTKYSIVFIDKVFLSDLIPIQIMAHLVPYTMAIKRHDSQHLRRIKDSASRAL